LEAMLVRYPDQIGWRRRLIEELERRGRAGEAEDQGRKLIESPLATEEERERWGRDE